MKLLIFSVFVLALVAFLLYKFRGLLEQIVSVFNKNNQPVEVIQLAKKGDKNILLRTNKFKLDELKDEHIKLASLLLHTCHVETINGLFSNLEEVKSKNVKPSDQGLYYLHKLLEQDMKDEYFYFFTLDWKAEIKESQHHLHQRLLLNGIKAHLPKATNYPINASVSYSNVLKDYTYALNKVGLGLGFIRTPRDEYILFIYHLEQSDATYWALSHVGLNIESYKDEWDE